MSIDPVTNFMEKKMESFDIGVRLNTMGYDRTKGKSRVKANMSYCKKAGY